MKLIDLQFTCNTTLQAAVVYGGKVHAGGILVSDVLMRRWIGIRRTGEGSGDDH